MTIEEIMSLKGDLRYDGKCILRHYEVLRTVKEFIFIFYGSSRDKKSRSVANALNNYLDHFNPDNGGFRKKENEFIHDYREN